MQKKQLVEDRIVFTLALVSFVYWLLANSIPVYDFAFVGALFELVWLPMLASVIFLPLVLAFMFFKRKTVSFRSLLLYAFFIAVLTWLVVIFL